MAPTVTTDQEPAVTSTVLDLAQSDVRAANTLLASADAPDELTITNPRGAHALACGLTRDVEVTIDGHVGYYCAGMNQMATVTINGSAGVGVAENMMSGTVRVHGDASQSAGATAHGGLLVIEGNAGARCGISMKGVDIVVGGNVGHMSAFMGQAGRLVVCGDAGEALGDSLYEARIYVRGTVASLGADCVRKPMREEHLIELRELLLAAGFDADPGDFTRYGSARQLYNFHVDNATAY
ncbi:GltB/FmdC/FwdC-like GXGXG domain-containing protein [Nocardia gipuzkoensis]